MSLLARNVEVMSLEDERGTRENNLIGAAAEERHEPRCSIHLVEGFRVSLLDLIEYSMELSHISTLKLHSLDDVIG